MPVPGRLVVGCVFVLYVAPLFGQEWTRFRGPNGSGISSTANLPVKWTEQDYAWKVKVPGVGHSSPVLWGERIFLTSGDPKTGRRLALCFDAKDGKTLWTKEIDGKAYKMHARNSFATSTPAVDDRHVYLCWATPQQLVTIALDHDGKQVWQAELGPFKGPHGWGVSPIVHDDLVIVPDDTDDGGALYALDRMTGKVRWKVDRSGKNVATYSTPVVYQPAEGRAELIFTNWQHGFSAIDPRSGSVRWELSVFERDKQERAIASPVIAGDLVLGSCGFTTAQKHLVAVKPGSKEQGTGPKEVWRWEKAVPHMSTPLVKDGLVFLTTEKGIATCLEAATGKEVWQQRLPGDFSSSPVCAGDRLYCVSDDGEVLVLAAGSKYQLLGRSSLGEPAQATPAIAGGRIIFRTQGHLMALGGK
jgi:outer membrane protein assembly factor BamB